VSDNRNRLADLLGIGHQPMSQDKADGLAADRIAELEAKLDFARAQLILANGYMSKAALKRFRKALGEAE